MQQTKQASAGMVPVPSGAKVRMLYYSEIVSEVPLEAHHCRILSTSLRSRLWSRQVPRSGDFQRGRAGLLDTSLSYLSLAGV